MLHFVVQWQAPGHVFRSYQMLVNCPLFQDIPYRIQSPKEPEQLNRVRFVW
jgi:hypothetical protein